MQKKKKKKKLAIQYNRHISNISNLYTKWFLYATDKHQGH
jgi:hypothetical protein